MKIVPIRILSVLVIVFPSFKGFANNGPPPPGIPPPPGLPIDGGVVLLFAAAIIYGLYKIHLSKLNKKTPI
jgi:hypothetical protein